MNRACKTCEHDKTYALYAAKECLIEKTKNVNLGFPLIGDQCRHWVRVPGSDDDYLNTERD